jgi:general secretion pathway protein G
MMASDGRIKSIPCLFRAPAGNDPPNTRRKMNAPGFTLIEVMVSICIIGLLAAIATPFYFSFLARARVAVAISDLSNIEAAVYNHVSTTGELPDTLAQVNLANLLDPWGNPYQYLRINGGDTKGKGKMRKDHFMVPVNSDFDLYSMGKDGKSTSPFTAKASQDDIVRAFNGGYYGKVADM